MILHHKKFNTGLAFWNQRFLIKKCRSRLENISQTIDRQNDLSIAQYAQLFALVLEFKPSLIIELGRGYGNSTAVFIEAANQVRNTRKVLSVCLSNDWQLKIVPKIAEIVPSNWFIKLDARVADITNINIERFIKPNERVLFFWDAHGWEVAEHVLGKILPKLQFYSHLVIVHDIMDIRYHQHLRNYNQAGVWKGYPGDQAQILPNIVINTMASPFEEVIALNDFAQRNNLPIYSSEHELWNSIYRYQNKTKQLQNLFGKNMANQMSGFYWFSLNYLNHNQKVFFPNKYIRRPQPVNYLINHVFKPQYKQLKHPLVSIITPCFNSSKYLKACIESVLNQNYPYVEHIIQDGGSTANTLKILKFYSKKKYLHRIKWISEPDNGQSDGLNKALQRASGDILLVLNADDMLLPDACLWGVEQMNKNPDCAAVYGDEYFIDEKGEIFTIYEAKHPFDYIRLFCVELVPPAQAAFIRTSMMKQVGLYADTALKTCPDYEMWVRLGAKFPIKHEFGIVCKYRHHQASEGERPDMVEKMVKAKLLVINRVIADPKTLKEIRLSKYRAYAGLYHWGANIAHSTSMYKLEMMYLIRSFIYRPKLHKIIRLIRFLIYHVPNYVIQRFLTFTKI